MKGHYSIDGSSGKVYVNYLPLGSGGIGLGGGLKEEWRGGREAVGWVKGIERRVEKDTVTEAVVLKLAFLDSAAWGEVWTFLAVGALGPFRRAWTSCGAVRACAAGAIIALGWRLLVAVWITNGRLDGEALADA
ncbi:hypothetical protein B0H14DRAFT_2565177 [Mycena olivaceomarginata]|nr:hypothetical protein B0H14DRAFT_2565177 [Mycena olivaceomarginata]